MKQKVPPKFFVEIVRMEPSEVVKRMGPFSESMADRVWSGAARNLNHDKFFVRTVEAAKEPKKRKSLE